MIARVAVFLPIPKAFDYSVPEGMEVPPRSLVMGSPGKVRRELTDRDLAGIQMLADRYVNYRLDYMTPVSVRSAGE